MKKERYIENILSEANAYKDGNLSFSKEADVLASVFGEVSPNSISRINGE